MVSPGRTGRGERESDEETQLTELRRLVERTLLLAVLAVLVGDVGSHAIALQAPADEVKALRFRCEGVEGGGWVIRGGQRHSRQARQGEQRGEAHRAR